MRQGGKGGKGGIMPSKYLSTPAKAGPSIAALMERAHHRDASQLGPGLRRGGTNWYDTSAMMLSAMFEGAC
jgi:hypothetical protein